SIALSMQALFPPVRHIPRPFWTVFAFAIYTAIDVAGREHIIGYWVAFWFIILFEEHMIFRRNTVNYIPLSSLLLIFFSVPSGCSVAGAVVGMAQVWHIGPIASKFGHFGGDVGFELADLIFGMLYTGLRYLEIKKFGR
ncbi:hypothetical protein M422DRAFT_155263, partial [Sphaerobolus stellatus SS14]